MSIILSMFILCVIVEAYFKYFYIATDDICISLSSRKWDREHCKYNSAGFRDDREFNRSKMNGVFKVGILGDSYVFGQGINNKKDRFSDILENLIQGKFKIRCEVYNMGKRGWSTKDERDYFLAKGASYKLDALVLCCLEIDDFVSSLSADILSGGAEKNHGYFLTSLLNNSYAFSFFYAQFYKLRYAYWIKTRRLENKISGVISDKNNWEKISSYIDDVKNQCKKQGIAFYIVSFQPTGWFSDSKLNAVVTKFEKLFKNYLDAHNIKYFFSKDYLKNYRDKDLVVNCFDFHPSRLVNKIVAEQLLNLMEQQLRIYKSSVEDGNGSSESVKNG